MAVSLDCPEMASWHLLFDDRLPPAERERCERHLESCPVCQERLDQDGTCEEALRTWVRRVGDPTSAAADPTLSQFLERLHEGKSLQRTSPGADLCFLRPTERPGVLGALGAYEVREVIGEGGMGVVLLAFEPALHRMVAIKVLALAGSAVARRRFTREAQAAAAVCHDHIVPVYGVHEADGLPYLVMQYIVGESLQDRLDRNGPLEVLEIVRIGMQTASGLAAAHAQGLIHRDIKPANLLLENGLARVKITDFGLARTADDVGLTQDGVVAGTPEYMAPEQARGEPVDHRADLFSLGSVLYALCTGVPPFRGPSAVAVLCQVNTQTPRPIRSLNSDVPAWLESVIDRLLAKDPDQRFQSAAEVANLLEGYLAHLRQPEVPAPQLPAAPADPWRPAAQSRTETGTRLPQRFWLLPLVLLAAIGLGLIWKLAGAAGVPDPKTEPFGQEYSQSFKGNQGIPPGWDFVYGPEAEQCVHFEPDGMQIRLPPGTAGERLDTGLASNFAVRGDFEITVGFEMLQEPRPTEMETARVTLGVTLDRPGLNMATLSRTGSLKLGTTFMAWRSLRDEKSGQDQQRADPFSTPAKTGRLRLVRRGSTLSFFAAEGSSEDFKRLIRYSFGAEDLKSVGITGSTRGARSALEVRLTDLRIRAESLPDLPTPSPQKVGQQSGWLAALLLLGITVALALALGVWLWVRGRGAEKASPAPVPDQQDNPEVAAPPVSFTCPGCGKTLKARAELAGKKVKCPQCGKGVVAAPRADRSSHISS